MGRGNLEMRRFIGKLAGALALFMLLTGSTAAVAADPVATSETLQLAVGEGTLLHLSRP